MFLIKIQRMEALVLVSICTEWVLARAINWVIELFGHGIFALNKLKRCYSQC